MMESITSTVGTLTTFVMAIAGISLVVAATSIFNVMMMSVTERIREIGILRSIGTQKSEVRKMFLYEAIILGVVGAGIGAIMSLILGWLVVLIMVGSTKYFFTFQSLVYVPMAMADRYGHLYLLGSLPGMEGSRPRPDRGAAGGLTSRSVLLPLFSA